MMQQSSIHTFHSMTDAEDAVKRLIDQQFPADQISIVSQNLQTEKKIHGYITVGDVARDSAGTGAWLGGLFGLLAGAAFVFVPGFGPLVVAGSFAAVLLGAIEGTIIGATGGGALGALVGWGVSKEHILKYEEMVKRGDYLVIANGDETQVKEAREILDGLTVEQVYPASGAKVPQV